LERETAAAVSFADAHRDAPAAAVAALTRSAAAENAAVRRHIAALTAAVATAEQQAEATTRRRAERRHGALSIPTEDLSLPNDSAAWPMYVHDFVGDGAAGHHDVAAPPASVAARHFHDWAGAIAAAECSLATL
jgi:hypothetical protein